MSFVFVVEELDLCFDFPFLCIPFQEYVFRIDTSTSLGLSSDCIASYCIGDLIRSHNLEVPELLPCGYLVGDNNIITVNLKGKNKNEKHSCIFFTNISFLFFFAVSLQIFIFENYVNHFDNFDMIWAVFIFNTLKSY